MYERVNWEDAPSTNTPINASNLNIMDKGIQECSEAIEDVKESTLMKNSVLEIPAGSFTTYAASGTLENAIKADYPYKYRIPMGGITADYKADVIPSLESTKKNVLCPYNQTEQGYVSIYAKKDTEDVTIWSITCTKEVV